MSWLLSCCGCRSKKSKKKQNGPQTEPREQANGAIAVSDAVEKPQQEVEQIVSSSETQTQPVQSELNNVEDTKTEATNVSNKIEPSTNDTSAASQPSSLPEQDKETVLEKKSEDQVDQTADSGSALTSIRETNKEPTAGDSTKLDTGSEVDQVPASDEKSASTEAASSEPSLEVTADKKEGDQKPETSDINTTNKQDDSSEANQDLPSDTEKQNEQKSEIDGTDLGKSSPPDAV